MKPEPLVWLKANGLVDIQELQKALLKRGVVALSRPGDYMFAVRQSKMGIAINVHYRLEREARWYRQMMNKILETVPQ